MANEAKKSAKTAIRPYKEMEFEEFLTSIGEGKIKNWTVLAEALGVDRDTLLKWRQHPKAQAALNNAINESMNQMELVGKDDWRMWRERSKILGVKDKSTLEHEVGEGVTELLDSLGRTDYDGLGSQAEGQMVADDPPIQNQE